MGTKVRDTTAKYSKRFICIVNIIFLVFGIIALTQTSNIDPAVDSAYFTQELNLQPLASLIDFCGVFVIIAAICGTAALFGAPRRLLVFYLISMLVLGFTQLVVGSYILSKECVEIKDVWFSTTAYYNDLRRTFKQEENCCGFHEWYDDYTLDQGVSPQQVPGCWLDYTDPSVKVLTCESACNTWLEVNVSQLGKASLGLGVVELLTTLVVGTLIFMQKGEDALFADSAFHY